MSFKDTQRSGPEAWWALKLLIVSSFLLTNLSLLSFHRFCCGFRDYADKTPTRSTSAILNNSSPPAVAGIVGTDVESVNSNQCSVFNKAGVGGEQIWQEWLWAHETKKNYIVLWVLLVIQRSNNIKVGVKEFLNVLTQRDLYNVTHPKLWQNDPLVFGKSFCIVLILQFNKKKGDL